MYINILSKTHVLLLPRDEQFLSPDITVTPAIANEILHN